MKDRNRLIVASLISFIVGGIMGAVGLFYMTRDFPALFKIYEISTLTKYSAMQNTRVLTYIRNSEKDKAIKTLEADLDSNILTLDSLRKNRDLLANEERENIVQRLKSIKKYRTQYPRTKSDAKSDKMVNEALSQINLDPK